MMIILDGAMMMRRWRSNEKQSSHPRWLPTGNNNADGNDDDDDDDGDDGDDCDAGYGDGDEDGGDGDNHDLYKLLNLIGFYYIY